MFYKIILISLINSVIKSHALPLEVVAFVDGFDVLERSMGIRSPLAVT